MCRYQKALAALIREGSTVAIARAERDDTGAETRFRLSPKRTSPFKSAGASVQSTLDTIGKLFEKILLARILHEVSVRGLMRDEQFGFRPRHSTSLQLARLVERITRYFGEKRLIGASSLTWLKPSIPSGSMASSTS